MSDPISLIGLVASVLQLIDTAVKVSDYLRDIKNASTEHQQFSNEIASLESLLQELERICDRGAVEMTGPEDPRVRDLQNIKSTLAECTKRLDTLKTKLETTHKLWKRLLWTKHKAEIKEMLVAIERFKALLGSWLHLDIWYKSSLLRFQTFSQAPAR
jgi:translation initiation factor 2 gamma subunit (eIF-2gamma)